VLQRPRVAPLATVGPPLRVARSGGILFGPLANQTSVARNSGLGLARVRDAAERREAGEP
jgi:hypothetical protein